jgi:hypothetical protein
LAAAVAWLALRHDAHALEALAFLLVAAGPPMHLFGPGGHGRPGGSTHDRPAPP